jgi:hypothetical protein
MWGREGRGVTGGIAWRSELMWKMSLRETNRLRNGVKLGEGVQRFVGY